MEKTKLGISVGLMAAGIYLITLFGGLVPAVLLAGYVLLFEDSEWLKKNAVKAVLTYVMFSVASMVLNLIPNAINIIDYLLSAVGGSFRIGFLSNLVSAATLCLTVLSRLLFLGLGLKALDGGTIRFAPADNLIEKHW